mgnify:FL=1|tara:strand:+ start:2951 stop:3202 length:252 start_codon:yes stop_codon:yes gene_type:complete
MPSSQTRQAAFANSSKESRRLGSNIAITIICLWAVAVGIGCSNLGAIRDVRLGFTGFEIETWEPEEYKFGEWQRSTNGVWNRR